MLNKMMFSGGIVTPVIPADQVNTVDNETGDTSISVAFKQSGVTKYHLNDVFSGHSDNVNTSAGSFDVDINVDGGVGDNYALSLVDVTGSASIIATSGITTFYGCTAPMTIVIMDHI